MQCIDEWIATDPTFWKFASKKEGNLMWLRCTEAYVQIATEAFDEGLWRLPSEAVEDAMDA